MALGGALGIKGVPLPSVETGIALSAILLGLMVALAAKPPLWVAGGMVGFFAIFQGHAHGTELPAASNAFAYAAGFQSSPPASFTSAGIGFGALSKFPWGGIAIRTGGGARRRARRLLPLLLPVIADGGNIDGLHALPAVTQLPALLLLLALGLWHARQRPARLDLSIALFASGPRRGLRGASIRNPFCPKSPRVDLPRSSQPS